MIILSFKNKKSADKMIDKAKKVEEYAAELVECLEEAKDQYEEYEDDEYQERNYRGGIASGMRSGRYNYRMR